jgi:glycosyltransferase involved in cell wall biosynthesis
MHVCNYFWLGGVPMFIRDFMQVYSEFHHVVVYLNEALRGVSSHADYEMMQEWELVFGADIGHADGNVLTKAIVDEIDPAFQILHCTPSRAIEGEFPHSWLNERPLIYVHHMPTKLNLGADMDLFVSEYLKRTHYSELLASMKNPVVCPPCIDAAKYKSIERSPDNARCVIGKLCSSWNAKKYPPQLQRVLAHIGKKYSQTTFEVVGAAKHWPRPVIPRLSMPAEKSKPVQTFLAGYDIFVYMNDSTLPETWGRSVTEAMAAGLPVVADRRGGIVEQIEDGVDGFLCLTEAEYIDRISMLVEDPKLRYEMGQRAREKACRDFGLPQLRERTCGVLFQSPVGVTS